MLILDIMEQLNKLGEKLKDFFVKYFNNPFMWLLFFAGGLFIFKVVYDALNKER